MISGESSASTNYNLTPPSPISVPLTVSSAGDNTLHNNFLYSHFQQSLSSRDTPPDQREPGQYATVISSPHQRQTRTLELSSSPSSISSSSSVSSSPQTRSCSPYLTSSPSNHNQLLNHHTIEPAQEKYYTQQPSFLEFQENNDNINTNSTCLSLNSGNISDLLAFHSFSFEADLKINHPKVSELTECDNTYFYNNLKITNNKSSASDNRQKVIRLPPFSALLSNHSVKTGVLESSQSIMRTPDTLFDGNNDTDMNINSFSNEGEETHYISLTNVGQSRLHEDPSCMDDAPDLNYLDWSYDPDYGLKSEPSDVYESDDFFYLSQSIPFTDQCNEMNMDSPTTDSDGYSSSPERDSFGQCLSITNAADMASHDYESNTTASYASSSDEGYGEGTIPEYTLPDFAKLQNRTDSVKIPQCKRTSALLSKEKKKSVRESLHSVEKVRQKPGRKPGQVSNVLHLWEFMRDLLHSPENHGIIEWISKSDGVFKVMNSTEVARLWGEKKKNKKEMTYEKLSRSLRYSRLEGYFDNLPKDKNYPKKLCFKFGPKSRNWR